MSFTKRMILIGLLISLAMLVGACGITQIQIVIVVTATPGAPETNTPQPTLTETSAPAPSSTPTPTLPPTLAVTPDLARETTATPLPPGFPTPVRASVQVAEQLFEGGRMFWLQPTQQIWVLTITGEGRGNWSVYEDSYIDGVDLASDPSIIPPEGRLQPERGFGKLWRESVEVREALGWAVTPEFGYISDYAYVVNGIDDAGEFVGYHVLFSLYGEQFRFNEIDGTWQLGGG
jgi:hypothetical protein